MFMADWYNADYKIREIDKQLLKESCEYRRVLGEQLLLASTALSNVQAVDNGDFLDDIPSLKLTIGDNYGEATFGILKEDAKQLIMELQNNINER